MSVGGIDGGSADAGGVERGGTDADSINDESPSWADQRRAAAAEHAAAQQRRQLSESTQARAIVAEFVAEARRRSIPVQSLTAGPYNGRGRYRTNVTGWYIRQNHSLGIGEDGEYYILSVPTSLRGRLTSVTVAPIDPPLVTGAGGRDGESVPLDTLLQQRLDAGDEFP